MPLEFIKLKISNIRTKNQASLIKTRLEKIPEINYAHIDLSNSTLYVKHRNLLDVEKIIGNCLLKMGYKLK